MSPSPQAHAELREKATKAAAPSVLFVVNAVHELGTQADAQRVASHAGITKGAARIGLLRAFHAGLLSRVIVGKRVYYFQSGRLKTELREKATSSNSIPVAQVRMSGPEVLALLDRIAALEAQVAEARELIRICWVRMKNAGLTTTDLEGYLTRYPQGAARVK